jgi:hypothetical protein
MRFFQPQEFPVSVSCNSNSFLAVYVCYTFTTACCVVDTLTRCSSVPQTENHTKSKDITEFEMMRENLLGGEKVPNVQERDDEE